MDALAAAEMERRAPNGGGTAQCKLCSRCEIPQFCSEVDLPLIFGCRFQMLPPLARIHSPADTIPVRHLHQSIGKSKRPITVVRWTPEGRRLLTGGHTGEFMLWNGTAFNFETVMDVRAG